MQKGDEKTAISILTSDGFRIEWTDVERRNYIGQLVDDYENDKPGLDNILVCLDVEKMDMNTLVIWLESTKEYKLFNRNKFYLEARKRIEELK
jgi:hypothetical protein